MLTDSSASPQLWTAAVADIVLFLKQWLLAGDSITSAEVWTQASPTALPIFQASIAVGVAGTGTGATKPYSQARMSFRTKAGGRAAFQVMESFFAVDAKAVPPSYSGNAAPQATDAYLTGSSSVVWGRDNSYIAAGIRLVTKTNDKLRKKYLNP